MANAYGAAVYVQPILCDFTELLLELENVSAETFVAPCGEARQHLRREGFIDLPESDVGKCHVAASQQRGDAKHRSQTHDAWIERSPFAVENLCARLKPMFLDRFIGSKDDPGGAIRYLGSVAGRHPSPGLFESGRQRCKFLQAGIRTNAVVMLEDLSGA